MNTIATGTVPAKTSTRRRWRLWTGGILGSLILVIVVAAAALLAHMNYVPDDLNLATTLTTAEGLYEVSYMSAIDPVPINQMQRPTLHLEDATGRPVENATITVDGDMPQHGHGLPTRPQVTRYLGNGDYLVEGLKFHMPGWWVVDFTIASDGQQDQVRFNLLLQ